MRFDGADLEESVPIPDEDPIAADQRLRLTLASFELPTYVQFGTSYAMPLSMSHAVTLTTAYRNNSFTDDDVAGGIEYGYRSLFFLRGGYVSSAQEDFLFGAAFGFGLQFQYNQSAIRFDYSNAESEFFDNNQWFSLAVGF